MRPLRARTYLAKTLDHSGVLVGGKDTSKILNVQRRAARSTGTVAAVDLAVLPANGVRRHPVFANDEAEE